MNMNEPTPPSSDQAADGARFARYELKIVLARAEAELVQAWATSRLAPDSFGDAEGRYEVRTVYLDSPELEIYQRLGDEPGTKFRVRRYGEEGEVWLERKRRRGDRVRKLRAKWPLADLTTLLDGRGSPRQWPRRFQDAVRGRDLAPVLLVVYPRSAFSGEGDIRLTLDWGVKVWRMRVDEDVFSPKGDPTEVTTDVILELKFDGDMPELFAELMTMLGRDVGSFSKYGRGVEAAGLAVTSDSSDSPDDE